jgi:hypothetical protein
MAAPWQRHWTVAVGGLTDVGFSPDERFVLAVGHAGRGVFDCESGERVGRDSRDDWRYLDQATGMAEGVGPIESQVVRVAGLMSGRALPSEHAGWRLARSGQGLVVEGDDGSSLAIKEDEDVRACGFSDSGRWLVVATASDLTLHAQSVADDR